MKHISRIIIAILIMAMLLPTAISCAETGTTDATTESASTGSPAASDEASAVPEDTLFAPSDIPEDLTFDGETIRLLYWSDVPNLEFFTDNTNGEAVNDAIYRRNENVQAQFGITLEFIGTKGNFDNQTNFVNACINSTQSGADAYDLFCGYSMTGATLMTQGVAQDLTDYEIIEFDKPWWPASLISKATIKDGIYFASGDISTNFIYMMYICAFNKDMFSNVHNQSAKTLYNLVYNDEWTLDKLIEYSTGVFLEQNGDNTSSEGDRFGFVATSVHFDPFFTSSDLCTIEVDADGNLAMSDDLYSQKTVDLLTKVCDFLYTSGECYTKKSVPLFANNEALFVIDRAHITSNDLTDTSFSYGILPVPKYDTEQDNYYTCMSFAFTTYVLSTASTRPEAAAAVLELMAYQSYINITPALFEESMKIRYADQSDDSLMFDIIREGVVIDLGRLFTIQLDKMSYSLFRNAVSNNAAGQWMSAQNAQGKLFNRKITDINKSLEELK